jgi:hypothetical protein
MPQSKIWDGGWDARCKEGFRCLGLNGILRDLGVGGIVGVWQIFLFL